MRQMACFSTFAVLLLLATAVVAQNQGEQVPPGLVQAQKSLQQSEAEMPPPIAPRAYATPPDELKRDADQLAQLAQQIPAEIEKLNRGVHDKALDDQLKQIEKLSKKLRNAAHR